MSPLLEYYCDECRLKYEVFKVGTKPYSKKCPMCNTTGYLVPSATGYRRDHTVHKDD